MTGSAIYAGSVVHTRMRPVRHRLRYRMLCVLFDLEALPALTKRFRLLSVNRFNLFAFHDRDHGDGQGALRPQIERLLFQAGISFDGGSISILCMPRLLGMMFNPLSVYFCRDAQQRLQAVLYEVTNTFRQRHVYVIPVPVGDATDATVRQRCEKRFYVSPFIDMNMTYHFRLHLPAETVAVAIAVSGPAGPVLTACFAGEARPLTDANLLRALLRHPLQAASVWLGIHWEALKLWRKGMRPRPRPDAADHAITIVRDALT
jgi:uncharacterized protein